MPTPLSPVNIANAALAKIGAQAITSLNDQFSASAIICNQQYPLAVAEVSRAGRWNCLLVPAQLTAVTQTSVIPPVGGPITATAWAPHTAYLANTFISYGNYYYEVMYDVTSSANFFNDLTAGFYTQQDQQFGSSVPDPFNGVDGSQYTSTWPFAYALPSDFQLLVTLNGSFCYPGWAGPEQMTANWQIMGETLYCNQSLAVIQYVQDQPDTTRFDSLFVNALTFKLAALICTPLRQDGGQLQVALLSEYKRALREARQKSGGEETRRRFNPIGSSVFNAARYRGLAG
jgi:hypothetical protein